MPKATKPPKPAANGTAAPPEVITLAEAAAFLRVSEVGLKADADAGRVPGRIVAGEWRFVKATLLAWLSQAEKPVKSSKERMLALAGMWKDDPTVDAMVEEIYERRKADLVGGT